MVAALSASTKPSLTPTKEAAIANQLPSNQQKAFFIFQIQINLYLFLP